MEAEIDMHYPKISIVTPSYNQGQFIEETILSVKNQDYPDIEHIIIDGGSTDNTIEILQKYEAIYNMRWVSEPDEGQADAVNKGFEMAEGDIIGWLNSDDLYFSRNAVSTIVAQFRKNPDVDIIYGNSVKINSKNKIMRLKVIPEFKYARLLRHCFIIQPSVFYRASVIRMDKLNISLKYSMDYEYWLRLGRKYKWMKIDNILSADRNHEERKIIKDIDKSYLETKLLRDEFGKHFDRKVVFFNNVMNKLEIGYARIAGVFYLRKAKNIDHAFNVEFDGYFSTMISQLFTKDAKLL
ncbi:Glycosyl transferase, family 2 [hydrothermal vent metagenome]|uniref:Glycosyl transferase, family 2 n=1 Tax=hydrothermal vent metagenome TaxID=652676 RepID=A0A3B1D3Y8_9ZZZZ